MQFSLNHTKKQTLLVITYVDILEKGRKAIGNNSRAAPLNKLNRFYLTSNIQLSFEKENI
jgi:hypothetical protein